MKSIVNYLLICLMLLPAITMASAIQQKNTVFQVSTINALAQGIYDGDFTYQQLKSKGSQGLGTFEDLDGEMVAVDGEFYQIKGDGKLHKVKGKQIVPFAEVIDFKPTSAHKLTRIKNFDGLKRQLDKEITNKNLPYAFRIDGTFKTIEYRSVNKQTKPFVSLRNASVKQSVFNLKEVKGTLVGFWFPHYLSGIAIPGYHFHFVSDDRSTGGHVLNFSSDHAKLSLAAVNDFDIYLPNTKSFSLVKLDNPNLEKDIKQAENK